MLVSAGHPDRGLAGVPVVWHAESFRYFVRSKQVKLSSRSVRIASTAAENRKADPQRQAARAHELVGPYPAPAHIRNHLIFPFPQEPDKRLIASLLMRGCPQNHLRQDWREVDPFFRQKVNQLPAIGRVLFSCDNSVSLQFAQTVCEDVGGNALVGSEKFFVSTKAAEHHVANDQEGPTVAQHFHGCVERAPRAAFGGGLLRHASTVTCYLHFASDAGRLPSFVAKRWGGGLIMLKIGAYVVIALIAIVLGLAAMKPDTFQVQRSTSIQAPPEKVVGLISDFHRWASWSPWEKLDPAMNRTYSGPASGKGSVYEWEGNGKVGKGRMELLDVTPEKVTIKLDFIKPFEGHNMAEFAVQPQGGASQVNWSMQGPMPFASKVMCVFVSMDKMVGGDFERGLANMKAAAENGK